MKNASLWVCLAVAIFLISGCATSKVATRIGSRVAGSYQEAAAMGLVSAEESMESWQYISGLIKGLYADNFELDVPVSAKNIIMALDEKAKQDTLTNEDKGLIIGYFCRLEAVAIKEGWKKYGITFTDVIGAVF